MARAVTCEVELGDAAVVWCSAAILDTISCVSTPLRLVA